MDPRERAAHIQSGDPAQVRRGLTDALRYKVLDLSGLELFELPEELAEFSGQFHTLNLSYNELRELPASISGLEGLEVVVLTKNPWRGFPMALLGCGALRAVKGAPGFARGAERARLEAFLKGSRGLEESTRRVLFRMLVEGEEATRHTTLSQLMEGLCGALPELNALALQALQVRSAGRPLEAGSSLTAVGVLDVNKAELKKAAAAHGITWTAGLTPQTTHIVLGRNPKRIEGLEERDDERGYTFLTAEQLQQHLNTWQGAALTLMQEETVEVAAHAENIAEMLLSGEAGSVELGLELIGGSGLPSEATTALYLLARTGDDAKQRDRARKLIKRFGSAAVQKVTAERSALVYTAEKAERRTAESLVANARVAPELDWVSVALYLRRRYGYGLSYALEHADASLRRRILREHVKEGRLNFFDVYSPGYFPSYDQQYAYPHYTPMTLPGWLWELTELVELDIGWLRLGRLSPGIGALRQLRVLRMRGNMFTALPAEILELPALEELHVGGNELRDFPEEIVALKGLRVFEVVGNRREHLYEELITPASVRAALPGCRFEDGLTSQQRYHNSLYVR